MLLTRRTGTHTLGVVPLLQETVNTTDGELETCFHPVSRRLLLPPVVLLTGLRRTRLRLRRVTTRLATRGLSGLSYHRQLALPPLPSNHCAPHLCRSVRASIVSRIHLTIGDIIARTMLILWEGLLGFAGGGRWWYGIKIDRPPLTREPYIRGIT